MSFPSRVPTVLLGLVAAVAAAGPGIAHAAGTATLYVNYTNNCTFTITTDSGAVATTIPPGTYTIQISTPQVFAEEDTSGGDPGMVACDGMIQFQLTGPGVSVSSTLLEGDQDFEQQVATFLPSSTYVAQDNNQPSVTQTTFSTAASGSPQTSSPVSSAPAGSATSSGSSSSALGSASSTTSPAPFVGTLTATVSAAGKLSLTFKGRPVATLKAGRYTVKVTDKAKKAGFIVQGTGQSALTLTGSSFVGTHSATVDLTAGQWFYYPTFVGAKTYFIVIK